MIKGKRVQCVYTPPHDEISAVHIYTPPRDDIRFFT